MQNTFGAKPPELPYLQPKERKTQIGVYALVSVENTQREDLAHMKNDKQFSSETALGCEWLVAEK